MANKLWMGGGQKFYVQEECECNQRKGWFDKISIRRSSSDTSLPPGGPGKNCERPSSGNSLPIRSKSCLGPFSRAGRNIQESKISHIRSSEVPIKISYDIVSISSSPLLLRMYNLAQSQLKEGRQSFWIDQLIYRNYLFLSLESWSPSAFLCWQTVPARFQYWILEILNRV